MEGYREELEWLWFENFCFSILVLVLLFFSLFFWNEKYDYIISPFGFGFDFSRQGPMGTQADLEPSNPACLLTVL